jgi:hypothetical protein
VKLRPLLDIHRVSLDAIQRRDKQADKDNNDAHHREKLDNGEAVPAVLVVANPFHLSSPLLFDITPVIRF